MANLTTEEVFQGNYPLEKIIEELDDSFPTYLPTPTNNLSEIMFRSGQRSVVEYLKTKLET
tara:strand:- start:9 stop:191 length:183 start_codon:yes stop_codon:yes gene_type:complete